MKKIIWISGVALLVLAIGFSFLYGGSTFGTGAIRKLVQKPTATTKKVTVVATKTAIDKTSTAKKTQPVLTEQLKNAAPTIPPVSAPSQMISSIAVSLPPADPTNTELSKINKRLDDLFTLVKNIPVPVNQTTIYQPERQCPAPSPVAEEPAPTPPASPTKALDESAVAYWKFEDQKSGAVEDSSGNNNSAALFGVMDFVDGKVGKAISLDGINDYLELNLPNKLSSALSEFTLELWVNLDVEQKYEYHCLISMGPPGEDENNFLVKNLDMCILNKGNIVLSYPRGEDAPYYLQTNNIGNISGGWHHIALVYDTENITVYRDGEAVGRRSATGLVTLAPNYKIRIGDNISIPVPTHAKGLFDELRIFDRALTQPEILTIYYAEQ